MSILGNRVLRKEDPKFLTIGGTYVDDLPLPGAAYVTYVRSTMAHATITSIDTTEAKKALAFSASMPPTTSTSSR